MSIDNHEYDEFEQALSGALSGDESGPAEVRAHVVCERFRSEQAGAASLHPVPARPRKVRLRRWATIAAILLVVFGVIAILPGNQTLRAQTVAALKRATSMICTIEIFGNDSSQATGQHTLKWVAPDTMRVDFLLVDPPMDETMWIEGKLVTKLDHLTNKARVLVNMPRESEPMLQFATQSASIEGLIKMWGADWEELPDVTDEGKTYFQYKLTSKDNPGEMHLLVDPTTFLPHRAEIKIPRYIHGDIDRYMTMVEHYRWNVEITAAEMTPSIPEGTVVNQIDGSKAAFPHAILPGEGVGEVRLGMTIEQVIELWGEPDEVIDNSSYNFFRHGVQIFYSPRRQRVLLITCVLDKTYVGSFKTFSGKTAGGVGIGSTEAEVIAALGKPDRIMGQRSPDAPPDSPSAISMVYNRGLRLQLQAGWVKEWSNEPRVNSITVKEPTTPKTEELSDAESVIDIQHELVMGDRFANEPRYLEMFGHPHIDMVNYVLTIDGVEASVYLAKFADAETAAKALERVREYKPKPQRTETQKGNMVILVSLRGNDVNDETVAETSHKVLEAIEVGKL